MPTPFRPSSFDHVALWVAERDRLADFACQHLGMHPIERTDTFTLVGVDAKLGKLTLFDAEGPRSAGALERVLLRVGDIDAALGRLPGELPVSREAGVAHFEAPAGLPMGLVEHGGAGTDYDLDHVVLRLPDVEAAAEVLGRMGFSRAGSRLAVADRHVQLLEGSPDDGGRPLLNHLALLVDSAQEVQEGAERHGFRVDDVKDAPNTLAVFLSGPADVRIEYVEHKPGFALV